MLRQESRLETVLGSTINFVDNTLLDGVLILRIVAIAGFLSLLSETFILLSVAFGGWVAILSVRIVLTVILSRFFPDHYLE